MPAVDYAACCAGFRSWELLPDDNSYPASLLDLGKDAPTLRGYGDPDVLLGDCLSVIGARKATPYGESCAKMAARVAAESGITVVSGGAIGCDCVAGTAAVEAGGKTVVIPGCGADVVYPRSSCSVPTGCLRIEGDR